MIGEKKLLISKAAVEKGLEVDCEVEGDTGYESGQSNKPVHTGMLHQIILKGFYHF